MANDHARTVAEALIAQLEQGTAPWTRPWRPGERFMPHNPTTGNDYRGANAMWLLAVAQIKGYDDARWMTYKQAGDLGAQVRRGEKGATVQYWKFEGEELVVGPDGEKRRERVRYQPPKMFSAVVFNASQIDGLPPPSLRPVLPEWERHEQAEAILANLGAAIRHLPGDKAYYNPALDRITLPERGQFPDADGYYETAIHEACHATGHPDRLNRDLAHPFGSEGYAREELRAEIGVLAVGERLGVGHNPARCASYVSSWIKALREDPREIFRASSDAEKISRYLQGLQRQQDLGAERKDERLALARTPGDEASQPQTVEVRAPTLIPGENAPLSNESERVYLAAPYGEKDEAKALGARWDKEAKSGDAPPGSSLEAFKPWLPEHADFRGVGHDGDPRQAFAQALREAGLQIQGFPEMDGRLHRVRVEGDRRGEKSGWYVGHADGCPNGKFGDHKTGGEARSWKSQTPVAALGAGDRARQQAENAQRRQERERREEAAHEAAVGAISARLAKAEPAPEDHPYLARKGVGAHGAFLGEQGELLVPVRSLDGALMGVQSIRADGEKRFARDGRLQGGCHVIGDPAASETVLIAEGYGTGADLHEKTGLPVAVAFNAGNLEAVARGVRERWPDKTIVVAGDNDHAREREIDPLTGERKKNVGREKAEAAAKAVGGLALTPKFRGESGTDWNDLGALEGEDEALKQIQEGLAKAERQAVAVGVKAHRETTTDRGEKTQTRSRGM